jgi:hypothetical protein
MSCKKDVRDSKDVYVNNFETADKTGIQNFLSVKFNGGYVLGPYRGSDFVLTVNDLPKHKLLKISFDLYIHDAWAGNNGTDGKPDLWQMMVDGKTYVNTTFSNLSCAAGNFCPPQAYPDEYPNNNHNPKSGTVRTDLPGLCQATQASTLYHIEKTITHDADNAQMKCLDKLVQGSVTPGTCYASWSVDNLKITAINL